MKGSLWRVAEGVAEVVGEYGEDHCEIVFAEAKEGTRRHRHRADEKEEGAYRVIQCRLKDIQPAADTGDPGSPDAFIRDGVMRGSAPAAPLARDDRRLFGRVIAAFGA